MNTNNAIESLWKQFLPKSFFSQILNNPLLCLFFPQSLVTSSMPLIPYTDYIDTTVYTEISTEMQHFVQTKQKINDFESLKYLKNIVKIKDYDDDRDNDSSFNIDNLDENNQDNESNEISIQSDDNLTELSGLNIFSEQSTLIPRDQILHDLVNDLTTSLLDYNKNFHLLMLTFHILCTQLTE